MKKIAIILGTRPEIIKMSPVIRACQESNNDFYILHTGQHYSYELDKKIFKDLAIPEARYNLRIGGEPYRKQVGFMTGGITEVLSNDRPDVVIVQGDTVSVVAGALAANKLGIKVAHHEAGLRSHDLTMIEETNRIITDHISDYLFAPTSNAVKNLTEESISINKIYLTGNTIVDAVNQNLKIAEKVATEFSKRNLTTKKYILASAHRAENVDVFERLSGIIKGLDLTAAKYKVPVIWPTHPRTLERIKNFDLAIPKSITCIDPVGFLDLLILEKNALLIMTDSGGLQEEALVLKVPCVTLRENTERPETVEYGSNCIAGTDPENILSAANDMLSKESNLFDAQSPFGDGSAGKKIIETINEIL